MNPIGDNKSIEKRSDVLRLAKSDVYNSFQLSRYSCQTRKYTCTVSSDIGKTMFILSNLL